MSEKDDFVEDLFRNLPKAPPFSEIDLKRHEKLIRAHIDEMKSEQTKQEGSLYGRFQTQFKIAAGFLVVIGGITFASSQGVIEGGSDVVVSMPTSKPSDPNVVATPKSSSTQNPGSTSKQNPGSTGGSNQQFESGDNSSESGGDKYLNNTGLDYQSQIDQIKEEIKLSNKPLTLSKMSQVNVKCAVELGINKQLLGIDKGVYEGESILAFYFGESKTNYSIWIVSKPCTKIIEL
jgi:hypothetical protein